MIEIQLSNYFVYSTDCLTQWNTNQKLKITGLKLDNALSCYFLTNSV